VESIPATLPILTLQHGASQQAENIQNRLKTSGAGSAQEADLRQEATELASLFIFQMLQAMRRTIPKSGLLDEGFAHDLYHSFFDQEVARHVAVREDFGLTALLMQQFRGNPGDTARVESRREMLGAYQNSHRSDRVEFTLPVSSPVAEPFSSSYGWRMDPLDQHQRLHQGVDIPAPVGAPVRAAAPGTVVFSGTQKGYGQVVMINHAHGYQTVYAHNAQNLVAVGEAVGRAQTVAQVGQTGRATGPHVHFEIRKDGQALDPKTMISNLSRDAK
jgi:murein DD-endopeptidase MepM/ murein hydrolase activator NlpD